VSDCLDTLDDDFFIRPERSSNAAGYFNGTREGERERVRERREKREERREKREERREKREERRKKRAAGKAETLKGWRGTTEKRKRKPKRKREDREM
jgi:hypothetical protein